MESEGTTKKMETSSSSDMFSLLPYDITLECLARVSIIYHPILSLVSKRFQTIFSSPDLHAKRSRIRKPEDQSLYVCLNLNIKDPNPRWFALSTIPKQQKLIPIPSPPNQKLLSGSTVLSTGSEIYIIGGCLNKERSKKVLLLDCRSHQWRRLPDMIEARYRPTVDVVNGKIHVFGGRYSYEEEVYDPKTKKWELNLDFTMKRYSRSCMVELENSLCKIWFSCGKLWWLDPKVGFSLRVLGLNQFYPNKRPFVASSTTRGRVTIWLMMKNSSNGTIYDCNTEIWCFEISLERRSLQKLWGFVEWSKCVFTFEGYDYYDYNAEFFLNSAIVTH